MSVAHLTPDDPRPRAAAPGRQGDRGVRATSGCSRPVAEATTGWHADRAGRARDVHASRARRLALDHWVVDAASLERHVDGRAGRARRAGVRRRVRRACSASRTRCCRRTSRSWRARSRARPGSCAHQTRDRRPSWSTPTTRTIEAAMTEGHPAFVANNGRIGFGARRLHGVRPRDRQRRSGWSGSPPGASTPASPSATGRTEEELYAGELDDDDPRRVRASGCATSGSTRTTTCYLPVHPWQWRNKLAITFAPDLARARPGAARRGRRTTTARSSRSARSSTSADPERHYVKTALAIQNMGFLRGLSPAYMGADAGDQRLGGVDVVEADPTLQRLRVRGAARARGDRLHRRRVPRAARRPTCVAVPEDARRAVAREPGAAARRGRAAGDDGVAAAPRRRRRVAGGRAGRAVAG